MIRTLISAILLSGCTMIDVHKPAPENWPVKQVNTYRVDSHVVSDVCQCYAPAFMIALGCTMLYFDQGKAEIWIGENAFQDWIAHEEKHAFLGLDHVGSDYLERALVNWRAGKQSGNQCKMPARMDEYRKQPFTIEFADEFKRRGTIN